MSTFTQEAPRSEGFAGSFTFEQLREQLSDVPEEGGVYIVLRVGVSPAAFLETNPGGRFKGRDPTVEQAVLQAKWVEGCEVVYIGKGDNIPQEGQAVRAVRQRPANRALGRPLHLAAGGLGRARGCVEDM